MPASAKVIRSEADYQAALARIDELIDASAASEVDELETWAILVEAYERDHFPVEAPEPLDFLRFVMEQRGLTANDLAEVIGSRPRASEVLAGRRELSKDMIRRIARSWDVPSDALLGIARKSAA